MPLIKTRCNDATPQHPHPATTNTRRACQRFEPSRVPCPGIASKPRCWVLCLLSHRVTRRNRLRAQRWTRGPGGDPRSSWSRLRCAPSRARGSWLRAGRCKGRRNGAEERMTGCGRVWGVEPGVESRQCDRDLAAANVRVLQTPVLVHVRFPSSFIVLFLPVGMLCSRLRDTLVPSPRPSQSLDSASGAPNRSFVCLHLGFPPVHQHGAGLRPDNVPSYILD